MGERDSTAGAPEGCTVAHAGAPGRLRLRVAGLRGDAARADRLAALLAAEDGIAAAEARAQTGSVILRFDPARADRTAVLAALGRALAASGGNVPRAAPRSRAERGARGASPRSARGGPDWHAMPAEAVVERLGSDAEAGLSEAEAAARLSRHGANVMPRTEPPSPLALFAKQFASAPVAMLGVSAAISLGTGGVADAVATLSIVAVNGVLGFVTEGQAERVIHTLMDSTGHPVRVVRGGAETRIPAARVVPGDVLLLEPGTQVSADARLISARALSIDESAMTGESLPVAKAPDASVAPEAPLAEWRGMVHAGTIVAEGRGRAVAVATGAATQAARTHALASADLRPQAPVERELEALGRRLAVASLAACGLFAAVGLARGYGLSAILRDALALAVAAVPEGLPMVATTTLSLGLRRMERRGILIRQMTVVEGLGAIQTICLDKTGTLTENRMEVIEAVVGTGDAPPCGTAGRERFAALAEAAALNNDAEPGPEGPRGSSQTERALMAHALALGLDVSGLRARRPRRHTIERGPGRPWMGTVHAGEGPALYLKGAPEELLARSSHVLEDGARRALTPEDRDRIAAANDRLAARPARVLAFARAETAGGAGEPGGEPPGADRYGDEPARAEPPDDPDGLTFLGLVAMVDPIRPGARDFVRRLHAAGIETVLITGDQAATAAATARALDVSGGRRLRIVDSTSFRGLPEDLLAGIARDAHVFARVASHEKLAIVRALQASGRVVAMTGDGVNDGPALNAADVGIAMGKTGADLARDVANVVIRDDDLGTLIDAIAQGRALHRNIRRSIEFLVTTNLSEILVSIAEALHGPGELETPLELLWINLVTDVLPGLGLALADPDADLMQRPPRPADEPIVPRRDAARMGRDAAVIAASSMLAHLVGLARHGPGPATRGMTFLALSQGQLLYTLVCQRSDPRHLNPDRLFENRTLDLALAASSALGALPFLVRPLGRLLGIAPLGARDTLVSLAAAAIPVASVLARRGIVITLDEIEPAPGRPDGGGTRTAEGQAPAEDEPAGATDADPARGESLS